MESLDEDVFDVGDLLEAFSLVLADLPYRMLYFDIEKWSTALILFTIKFVYKTISYPVVMMISPKIRRVHVKCGIAKPSNNKD